MSSDNSDTTISPYIQNCICINLVRHKEKIMIEKVTLMTDHIMGGGGTYLVTYSRHQFQKTIMAAA